MSLVNPRNNFSFLLQIDGIEMARVQMVTPPSVEWTEHRNGAPGNQGDVKTPGKKIVGDLVVEMIIPDAGDSDLWQKFQDCATNQRAVYAGDGVISELDATGAPVQNWKLGATWFKKIETANFETVEGNSDNLKRTVTCSVEDYSPAP